MIQRRYNELFQNQKSIIVLDFGEDDIPNRFLMRNLS